MRLPIDPNRFRGPALVAFKLAIVLGALNSLLILSMGTSPEWLVPEQAVMPWDLHARERLAQRLRGIAASLPTDEKAAGGRLIAYFGMSTATKGIDSDLLSTLSGYPGRIVAVCGTGGSIPILAEPIHLFSQWRVRPALSLIVAHPSWLVGRPTDLSKATPLWESFRKLERSEFLRGLSELNWAKSDGAYYLSYQLEKFLLDNRVRNSLISAERNPWPVQPLREYASRMPDEFLDEQRKMFARYGWFDPEAYRRLRNSQMKLLSSSVKELRELGSRVVLILMAESDEIRNRVPPEAAEFLKSSIREEFGVEVVVWDFRHSIGEDRFSDLFHLNAAGRREFTHLLARHLKETFPTLFTSAGRIHSSVSEE